MLCQQEGTTLHRFEINANDEAEAFTANGIICIGA